MFIIYFTYEKKKKDKEVKKMHNLKYFSFGLKISIMHEGILKIRVNNIEMITKVLYSNKIFHFINTLEKHQKFATFN